MSGTVDIATLGIALDTTDVARGKTVMDSTGDAAEVLGNKVEAATTKVKTSNAAFTQHNDSLTGTERASRQAADAAKALELQQHALGGATQALTLGQVAFLDKLKDQAAAAGLSKTKMLELQAASMGLSDVSKDFIAQIEAATLAQGKHGFSMSSNIAKMEALRAVHDLMIGSYTRMGSALLVLGNASGATSTLFAGMGAALLLPVAALGVLAYAIYEGHKEQEAFNNSLVLTAGYAGITADQFAAMTQRIAEGSNTRLGPAREALQALVATGKFTGDALLSIGGAAVKMAELTGGSAADIVKDFEGMTNGVAKWALDANDKYHFLTAAQYNEIAVLEEQGKKNEAMTRTGDLLNASLTKQTQILGYFPWLLKEAGDKWDVFWNKAKNLGNGAEATPGEKLEHLHMLMANQQFYIDNSQGMGAGGKKQLLDEMKAFKAQEIILEADSAADIARVQRKAQADEVQAAGAHAIELFRKEQTGLQDREELHDKETRDAQDQYDKALAAAKASGQKQVISKGDLAEQLARIDEKYQEKNTGSDTRAADLANLLRADQDQINAAKAKYEQLGKLADLYHQYGIASDADYYAQKKAIAIRLAQSEIDGYDQRIADLKTFHAHTDAERAANAGKIAEERNKKLVAEQHLSDLTQQYAVQEYGVTVQAQQKADDALTAHLEKLKREADAAEAATLIHAKSRAVLEAETIATYNNAIAKDRLKIANLGQGDEAEIARLQKEIAAYAAMIQEVERYSAAKDKLAQMKIDDKAFKDAVASAKSMETELVASFGNIGTAIGGMTAALATYADAQHQLELSKATQLDATKDVAKQDRINAQFQIDSIQLQLKQYGDLAGAASQFFNKTSTGYKALQDVEKVYRIAQMALALQSFVQQSGLLAGLFEVKQSTAAASATLDKTQTAGSVENAGIRAMADGVAAFAKTLASQPYPYNLIAGATVVAALAAVGVAIGGGGGGSDAPSSTQLQTTQGTGTVAGDASKQSESIAKSIALLANNSSLMLPLTSQMATSLQGIQNGINGVGNILAAANGGVVSGSGLAAGARNDNNSTLGNLSFDSLRWMGMGLTSGPLGSLLNKLTGDLFGKSSASVTDSGLKLHGTIGQLEEGQGQGVDQYANLHSDTSSFFGLSHSSSDATQTGAVDPAVTQQFGLIFKNLQATLQEASTALGKSSADVGAAVQNMVIDTSVSLKGLSGAALTTALNAVISAATDNVSRAILPGLDAFTQTGEGYTQTLVRVATGIEQGRAALDKFGITAINFTAILNKQGDVGAEIVRQSIATVETLNSGAMTGVGKIIASLQGTTTDLAGVYASLLAIRAQLAAVGASSTDLGQSLISGAGGLSQLASGMNDYLTKYFSASEQAAAETNAVDTQLRALGQTMPTTLDGFKAMIQAALSINTDASQKLAGQLIALSGAFATALKDTEAASAAAATSSANALAPLQANVDAARANLTTAYNTEATALNGTITSMHQFAQATEAFRNGLLLGADSTLSPEGKYSAAKSQYEATLTAAQGGDKTAQGALQGQASAFLAASKAYNASTDAYAKDFNAVQAGLKDMVASANAQASNAQAQLDALNQQVSGLIQINKSVISVAQAIAGLQAALATQKAAGGSDASALSIAHGGLDPNAVSNLTDVPVGTLNKTIWAADDAVFGAPYVGSHANGLERVPHNNYRADLHEDEMVLTAPQANAVRNADSGKDACAESKKTNAHLQALVALQQAANQALLTELGKSNAALEGLQKKARLAAAAPKK